MKKRPTKVRADAMQQSAAGFGMPGLWAQSRAFLAVGLIAQLSACAAAPPTARQVSAIDPKNGDGLGGTGVSSSQLAQAQPGDGLGGTGIIGTISGFGSIIVNGLELEFDRATAVGTDGRPTSLDELRVGQVIQGVAREKDGRLHLESLDIQHAVSGPIGAIDYAEQTITVLGQNIRLNLAGDKTATASFKTLRAGDMVSVSGLRLSDGTIVATRVDQHADDGRVIVRGEATAVTGNTLRIGALDVALNGDTAVTKPVPGGRVFVSGRMINKQFVPDMITGGTGLPFGGKVGEVSLEGYAPETGPLVLFGAAIDGKLPDGTVAGDHVVVTGQIGVNVRGSDRVTATSIAKVRTVVTIMKARGTLRPAAVRPDDATRPERVVPSRPQVERPQSIEKPTVPERPVIERPGSITGV
jgi:hypothetical protein